MNELRHTISVAVGEPILVTGGTTLSVECEEDVDAKSILKAIDGSVIDHDLDRRIEIACEKHWTPAVWALVCESRTQAKYQRDAFRRALLAVIGDRLRLDPDSVTDEQVEAACQECYRDDWHYIITNTAGWPERARATMRMVLVAAFQPLNA